ncbi:hypothetical protein CROQUDRAFT_712696 [Cronartium quercuum f. sp. fusiforme G11]|uniref:Vacuolar sorting protein Vps3844 C-terminal domain-containing protein n=1 Tax=Cronartium quercuum f. sp. fusiforme G11 TaxID=708437 RepID=A0A9P6NQY8_9BASI|nr:hypothetical protein CROQUDRAFT_712696 [Cronartium quercuum f. sp. fusiforme G11]
MDKLFLIIIISSSLFTWATSQLSANIYIKDPTNSNHQIEHQNTKTTSLTCSELNAFLSHHLDISHYETLPESLHPKTRKSQLVFGSTNDLIKETDQKITKRLIVIYGTDGKNLLNEKFLRSAQHFSLPSPPDSISFDGLISTYVGRLVHTFKIPISSIYGVKDFFEAYHNSVGGGLIESVKDWAHQWEDSLDQWLDWVKESFKDEEAQIQMIPKEKYSRWLNEYGVLDESAKQFIKDLESLDQYFETTSPSSTNLSLLRLSGLEQIARQHGQNSLQFDLATKMLKKVLDILLLSSDNDQPIKTILIIIPPKPFHNRLGNRTSFSALTPFKTSEQSFIPKTLLNRRSEIFAGTPNKQFIPIISSTKKCYKDLNECERYTKNCNGNGNCVEGQKSSGGNCFICNCSKSKGKDGKLINWSGEMCQKKDISRFS